MRPYSWAFSLAALAVLATPATAQTMSLDYNAGAAQSSGSSADYAVNFAVSPIQSQTPLNLVPGVTIPNVDLGTLSFSSTGRGPNNVIETIPFSFNRSLSLTLNGDLVASSPETLSGTWGGERGGGFGQYFVTNLTLNGNSAVYDFGSFGTVEADFQPGTAFNDGLSGPTTIPVTANLTFHTVAPAVPEPAPLALLALGIPALTVLCARKRRQNTLQP